MRGLIALLLAALLAVVAYDAWEEHQLRRARRAALWLELRHGLPEVRRAWMDKEIPYEDYKAFEGLVRALRWPGEQPEVH